MRATEANENSEWKSILNDLRVVRLTVPLQLLVPSLLLPSLSKSTRGLSLHPGKGGLGIGMALLGASLVIGALLLGMVFNWSLIGLSSLAGSSVIVEALRLKGSPGFLLWLVLIGLGVAVQAAQTRHTVQSL